MDTQPNFRFGLEERTILWRVKSGLVSATAKIWQDSRRPSLESVFLHIGYCRKNLWAGCCRVAEEALPGKACLEWWLLWISSKSLYDQHSLVAEKARGIGEKEALVRCSYQPQYTKCIQFDAMDSDCGGARECPGVGIPLQHHPGLLPGPGSACTNSIGHDEERDDMLCPARISPCTPALEYHLWWFPEGGNSTMVEHHLLCQQYPGGHDKPGLHLNTNRTRMWHVKTMWLFDVDVLPKRGKEANIWRTAEIYRSIVGPSKGICIKYLYM